MADNIANMLTSIRNAQMVRHESAAVPYSKVNFGILKIMKQEGWINDVGLKKRGQKELLVVILKYNKDGSAALSVLKRISKLGKRIYIKKGDIRPVRNGYGLMILSTPQGIITGKQAKSKGVGGEVLCKIW